MSLSGKEKRGCPGWIDHSGLKCTYPPPGVVLSPAHPFHIPATSHNTERGLPTIKEDKPKPRAIQEGVYYDRHRHGFIAYWWLKQKRKKFIIGCYPSYSQALIARNEFLDTIKG